MQPQDFLSNLTEEAQAAFEAGQTYEYQPESAESADWYPYPCNECSAEWHQCWICKGFRIENHQVFDTIWECDEGGNWEQIDECNVADLNYSQFEKEYSYENSVKASRAYSQWVAQRGQDPLGEFHVQRTEPRDFYVEIKFENGAFWFKRANFIRRVEKLPEALRTYLGLDDQGKLDLDWSSMDQFEQEAIYDDLVERNGDFIKIKLKIDLPRSQAAIEEDLKKLAKRCLK